MPCKGLVTGFIIFFFAANLSAARPDSVPGDKAPVNFDTLYLADYTGLLTARLFLLYQNSSLFINPAIGNISSISYRPNANVRFGIAGFWRWFGLGVAIDNPFYKTSQETYGKTTTVDLRVNAYGRQFAGELFMQRYKGFYIGSPEREDGSHYIIPGMRTFSIGMAGYWIYNSKRFSIRAAFTQNERQKKSAGSLVVRPAFLFYRISSDDGIIPQEIIDQYQIPAKGLVSEGTFYSYELSPGYVYTLVFLRNFYLTAALFPGVAAQVSSFSNQLAVYDDFEFAFQLSGRFAVGYNSDKWFLGGSIQTGFNELPDQLSHARFSYDVSQIRFWGGTRFSIFKKKPHTPAAR